MTHVDFHTNLNCSAPDNECQHLNATQLLPFVLIDDNNDIRVANLSTYVVPEFFIYQENLNSTNNYIWYDAVPCTDYYLNIYGSYDNMP